jgi:hypothetical protein
MTFLNQLARFKVICRFVDFIENVALCNIPKKNWGYIIILADKNIN